MSGISGSHGFGADTEAITRAMTTALAPGGAEAEPHLAVDGGTGLGTLAAEQPAISADGRHALVLDGAIHNHPELRTELEAAGEAIDGDSAAHLALAALRAWGPEALDRFRGPFALALHDREADTLTLGRDHLGIRPLFVAGEQAEDGSDGLDGAFLFASSLTALLAADRLTPAPDDRAVYRYLRLDAHDEEEQSFLRGIRRVLPGQVLVIGPDGATRSTYTRLREELAEAASRPGRPLDEAALAEVRARFEDALRLRLRADQTVGVTLAGGLGSSALAAEVAAHLRAEPADEAFGAVGPRLHAVSAVVPGSGGDQAGDLGALAADFPDQIQAHPVHPDAEAFLADLEDLVRTLEEPAPSSAAYARYAASREASGHVELLLDGLGAQEVLAADERYVPVRLRQLRRDPRALAREVLGSRELLARGARERLSGRAEVPTAALMNSAFVAAHSAEKAPRPAADLRERLAADVLRDSLPARLRVAERTASRFGLQRRTPFLDLELLRLVAGLDASALVHGGRAGHVLRELTAEALPERIARRREAGEVTVPEGTWFVRLAPQIREIFASESFAARPYVDARSVLALFDDLVQNPGTHDTAVFWRLLNLELWLRAFCDDAATAGYDPAGTAAAPAAEETDPDRIEQDKPDHEANPGKELDLVSEVDGHRWRRLPLQTALVARGDDLTAAVAARIEDFAAAIPEGTVPAGAPWYFVISEKIVAITQGRSWFTWEIRPRLSARVLSRFVSRTPAGIGLGDPTTMELAIREVGLPRVTVAAAAGAAGKVLGRRGVFYEVVGDNVRAIDGPTPYSAFPSNVSAKLPPKDPDQVAARLSTAIRQADIPAALRDSFAGTVVMDANDIGRNQLGSDLDVPGEVMEATFADNPLGQGRQRTPMAVLVDLGE